MPEIAVVVLAHRAPVQIARLVRSLTDRSTGFYVHLDRRSSRQVHRSTGALLGGRDDVRLLRPRRTPWGGFGIVLALLDGLQAARTDGARTVVVLSGQDYPIRPTEQVVAFLTEHRGTSFLEHRPLPRPDWRPPGGLERYDARGVHLLGHDLLVKSRRGTRWLPRRPVQVAPLRPHHGSPICSLSAQACDWLLTQLGGDRALQRAFRAVQLPDETAVHTVLASSHLDEMLVNDNLLYADWSANADHPEELSEGHLPALASSAALFARKFDLLSRPQLLDRVDVELRRAVPPSS